MPLAKKMLECVESFSKLTLIKLWTVIQSLIMITCISVHIINDCHYNLQIYRTIAKIQTMNISFKKDIMTYLPQPDKTMVKFQSTICFSISQATQYPSNCFGEKGANTLKCTKMC